MNLHLQLRKYLRSYPEWKLAPPRVQLRRALQKVGSEYGGYFLDPSGIGPDAVVYSLGIGEDISFDLSLIHQYGVTVHAFDPTPQVKKWLASQKLPDEFCFHDTGIADFDGEGIFYLPPRPDHVSHSVVPARQFSRESIPVPMMRLGTAMERLGHSRIGLMKMDIEGGEYGVLEDLVRERIPVEQILVEFHHRFSSIGTAKTRRMLSMLEDYGMRICYVCPRVEVFTLVRSTQSGEWAAAAG
jgi:FkbM family methyltransferase